MRVFCVGGIFVTETSMNPENPVLEDFANKAQVAEFFGVTERTVDRWVRLRAIPQPRKVGRQRLWHLPTLRKSLAQGAAA
jgi:predicted DNA-binding transcriptional regulator AlpA